MTIVPTRASRIAGCALLLAACAQARPAPEPAPAPSPTPAAATPPATFDRTVPPPAGPSPEVDLPPIHQRTLSNGLRVLVVEDRDLPLVTLRLLVNAATAAETPAQAGLASFTSSMLDEGTRTRTALQIADELDYLGAAFGVGPGYDATTFDLSVLSTHLPAALEVFADIITQPTFPAQELERLRRERLTSILQSRDQAGVLASDEFARRVFGAGHPYGRTLIGTEQSVRAITAEQMRRFYTTWYRPNNAHLVVVGDVSTDALVPLLERALGRWQRADVPPVHFPATPARQAGTRIFLIDKPGAAQSEIRVGHLSVPRDNPDYFPLLVLNTVLGGQFSSRINLNLREDKGYTYGARSAFAMRRAPGSFVAQAGVQTPSTRESVIEFMKELEEIRGARPVTDKELEFAKASLIRGEPRTLETQGQLIGRLGDLVVYGLPLDYFDHYTRRIAAVTRADVERVARQYLDPAAFAIVVVGDRSVVEPGLRQLPYPVEVVPVEAPTGSGR